MAGVGNAEANRWPLLLLAGSSESNLVTKGAFQELDAVSLLTPHTKAALRASSESIPRTLSTAYRSAWYGKGGTGFIDLPADVIQGDAESGTLVPVAAPPRIEGDRTRIAQAAQLLKNAKSPLIIIGKGAAYARAEGEIRNFIETTQFPFLPTPMGKGVMPDTHPLNTSAARSVALREADVVLVLGARLNWILHFGESPKWAENVKIIQVDNDANELGKNAADPALAIHGDINAVVSALQINTRFPTDTPYWTALRASITKNEVTAAKAAKVDSIPMTYAKVFDVIKSTIHSLSKPEDGEVVYVSEGANTMDISRSIFSVEHPRLRLDAGTSATMGVGMGYAIAAHMAYNIPSSEGSPEGVAGPSTKPKKIVCLEGDSAFGFSLAEVETMARYKMPILVFVVNNSGVYHGDSADEKSWREKQALTIAGKEDGLRSSSLSWETGYEKIAEMCGGKGYLVRTPQELEVATREGFKSDKVTVVNVIIEAGQAKKLVGIPLLHSDQMNVSGGESFSILFKYPGEEVSHIMERGGYG